MADAAPAYLWQAVSRGDRVPEHAVTTGTYGPDGTVYVGRLNGEVGKINLKDEKVWNFRAHHQSHSYSAEIFVCAAACKWIDLNKGDQIPGNAVLSGQTATDGWVYVGQSNQEPGKINVADGKMNHFWSHHQGKCLSAKILVVDPPRVPPAAAVAAVAVPQRIAPQAPTAPDHFPSLATLPQEELAQLAANEVLQKDLLQEHQGVQDFAKKLQRLSQENATQAQELLSREAGIEQWLAEYDVELSALNALHGRVHDLAVQKDHIKAQQSPSALAKQLQEEAGTADQQAETFLHDSLQGGTLSATELQGFSRQFLQMKKEKHSKLALKEMLLNVKA